MLVHFKSFIRNLLFDHFYVLCFYPPFLSHHPILATKSFAHKNWRELLIPKSVLVSFWNRPHLLKTITVSETLRHDEHSLHISSWNFFLFRWLFLCFCVFFKPIHPSKKEQLDKSIFRKKSIVNIHTYTLNWILNW